MSVCAQTPEEESGSEDTGPAIPKLPQAKAVSKLVRVLTVLAYLLSVSLAAILLSVYYIWVWKSPEPPAEGEGELEARKGDLHEYGHGLDGTGFHHFNTTGLGGRNTTVSNVNPTPTNVSLPTPDRDVTAAALVNSTSTENDLTEAFNSTSELLNLNSTQDLTNYTETNAT